MPVAQLLVGVVQECGELLGGVHAAELVCAQVCCSVWQCVAVCCLQCVAVCCSVRMGRALGRCARCGSCLCAVCCGVLQCVGVCVAVQERVELVGMFTIRQLFVRRCVAVCCSVLQCVAVCCSVLQCVAVWCSVLQCGVV